MRDERVAFKLLEYNIIEIFCKDHVKTIPKKQLNNQVRNDEYFCIIPLSYANFMSVVLPIVLAVKIQSLKKWQVYIHA